jgi:ubiquinone/menaquinone biosynthesis C-methylase UbiE
VKTHLREVGAQFDRQAGHYLARSAMADRAILDAILAAAPAGPGDRVLDVACGAGLLLRAYRQAGASTFGVDLSERMLKEARGTLSGAAHLARGDAEHLPLTSGEFDVVASKLAFHYLPFPGRALAEMSRVCRPSGRIALIDRVTVDDPEGSAAHNRLERLRTPNKVRVYAGAELAGLVERAGLEIVHREVLVQPMGFDEWMAAAGALDRTDPARALLLGPAGEDLTGLAPRQEAGGLVIHHRTLILVARRTT